MKKQFAIFILFLLFAMNGISQTPSEANPVIIVTWIYQKPNLQKEDTLFKNFNYDSLVNSYVDRGIRPNQFIKNFRILNHYWGEDSYKTIFVYEVDGFPNLNKAEVRTTELIDASFKNETEKKLFWRKWNLIFDRHEDGIWSDSVRPKI